MTTSSTLMRKFWMVLLVGCAPLEDPTTGTAAADPTEDTAPPTALDLDSGELAARSKASAAACAGSSCDGLDADSMGCTGASNLTQGKVGELSFALRSSSVCDTTWVRAWRHTSTGWLQAKILREADWTAYQSKVPNSGVGTKEPTGMVYCPSGSCRSMACLRDSSTGPWTCTDWY